MYLHLLQLFFFILFSPCSIEAAAGSSEDHAAMESQSHEATRIAMETFCDNHKITIKTTAKTHKAITTSLISSSERGVICGAQSTKAGFKKDHHYMIQISNMPLHQEAYILQEMIVAHPAVIRCIWDCVPHPLIMPLPKSHSQRNPLDVGKTPVTYHLLVLESFDGLTARYWIDTYSGYVSHDSMDESMQVLDMPRVITMYNNIKTTLFKFWNSGWIHRDLHLENILANPFTHEYKITQVHEAVHYDDGGVPMIQWLDWIMEDFQLMVHSFAKHALRIDDQDNTQGTFDTIFQIMEHFDPDEFSTIMTFARSKGQHNRIRFLPPRFRDIVDILEPPSSPQHPARRPLPRDGLLEAIARNLDMTERSVSISNHSKSKFTLLMTFISLLIMGIFIFHRKIHDRLQPMESHLLASEEL